MAALQVRDNVELERYELVDGDSVIGVIDYRRDSDALVLEHVEVEPALRGRGLGCRLVAGALEDVRARGLSVVPQCPFAEWYLDQHPEQADLLAQSS